MRADLLRLRSLRAAHSARQVFTRAASGKDVKNSKSLLKVPGIGRRAVEQLAQKQVGDIDQLCAVYLKEVKHRDALVDYLAVRLFSLVCLRFGKLLYLCVRFSSCASRTTSVRHASRTCQDVQL